MDIVERLRNVQVNTIHWVKCHDAADEIERLREIIANYERDHSAGAGMAPIRKLGETTVEERSRSTGFSQRSRGYGSEDI
jgi:hypothetical protein